MSLEILAIIPARSGSKGLPGKNIRLLLDKPLIAWTIETALKSKYITRVVFSTNSNEYADIARRYGADVPFLRPEEFASDTANDLQVLTHAVTWLKDNQEYRPDLILRLQPTNPTFPVESIDEGIELMLNDENADSLRAITPSPKHPFKMWKKIEGKNEIQPFFAKTVTGFDEPFNMGRQQLPEVFVQVGAMEILRYDTLMKKKSMAGNKILSVVVNDPLYTVNIDTELDFMLAEAAIKKVNESKMETLL